MNWTVPILCVAVALTGSLAQSEDTPPVESAKVFYVGWDLLTRAQLAADDVRRSAAVTIVIDDAPRALAFYRWATGPGLLPVGADEGPGDARLVIDFRIAGGGVVTYYASRFKLYTSDSAAARPIDEKFRSRFRYGESKGGG